MNGFGSYTADPHLVGNGRWCSSCCPNGRPVPGAEMFFRRGCNECAGQGRIALSDEEIVANTVSEITAWKRRKRSAKP